MQNLIRLFLIIFLASINIIANAKEFAYILNDECINSLYNNAAEDFKSTKINVIKDPRGIILRFELKNPLTEYEQLTQETYCNLKKIEYFLSKNENPAIIEVHAVKNPAEKSIKLKNWEISTVIANKMETLLTERNRSLKSIRINSVGYGEFLPAKNTPNNGSKYSSRVDIIILCNVSGE